MITAVITASPLKSHPDTRIIDETIQSVREQLPDAEIIVAHDGVRAEQEHMRAAYEEYQRRFLWKAAVDGHILPLRMEKHVHQAVCTKRAIETIETPLMLFVEGDTPLCGDIPWTAIGDTILDGDANVVRFSHEVSILEPHRYLMLDGAPLLVRGVPMVRTVQWSQRPHLASTAFYRSLLDRYFPNGECNYVEDVVYGKLIADWDRDGEMAWNMWRTWIYAPDGNIQRSLHTDGRDGESKF